MSGLTHISASGEASMVDVSEKDVTARIAVAECARAGLPRISLDPP